MLLVNLNESVLLLQIFILFLQSLEIHLPAFQLIDFRMQLRNEKILVLWTIDFSDVDCLMNYVLLR